MKMTLIVAMTAMVACVSTLARSAALYGLQSSRSKEHLGLDDEAGGRWWIAAVFTKRRSNHAAVDPTQNYYYYLQRQVADLYLLYSVYQSLS